MKLLKNITAILFLGLFMVSCAAGQLAFYDPQTHKELSYLIPQIQNLYNSYTTEKVNSPLYNKVDLSIRQLMAYEESKKHNEDTYKQIEILHQMFKRHYGERMIQESPWSLTHKQNKLRNILSAVNLIIDTELLKNEG